MFDLTTIGEGQIRLTVPQGERLSNTRQLRMTAACSEANVAGLLSQLGRHTSWCSVLPHSDLAERCISEFRSVGVDMSNMIRVPEGRVALYFMEPGEPPMPSRVTYDRLNTAFREIRVEDVNWDSMLNTRLVFVTGITTALTKATAKVIRHFVDAAHERNIDIALDVNYRGLLWSPERAREVLTGIASRSRIIFCSRKDAGIVFGIEGERAEVSRQLREAFGAEYVVSTDGHNGVYYAGPDGLDDRVEGDLLVGFDDHPTRFPVDADALDALDRLDLLGDVGGAVSAGHPGNGVVGLHGCFLSGSRCDPGV